MPIQLFCFGFGIKFEYLVLIGFEINFFKSDMPVQLMLNIALRQDSRGTSLVPIQEGVLANKQANVVDEIVTCAFAY